MDLITLENVQPGDLLLVYDDGLVSFGQSMSRFLKRALILPTIAGAASKLATSGRAAVSLFHGSFRACHAAIVYKQPRSGSLCLAHAVNSGVGYHYFEDWLGKSGAWTVIFRPPPISGVGGNNQKKPLGDAISDVALAWAGGTLIGGGPASAVRYSMGKAFLAGLTFSYYGSSAKERAAHYRTSRSMQNGPSSLKSVDKKSEMFCSMFAIAVIQAAMASDDDTVKYMALDAKHTSPSTLDGYVTSHDTWARVGDLPGGGLTLSDSVKQQLDELKQAQADARIAEAPTRARRDAVTSKKKGR